ncbi:MAG: hypothetical protein FWE64_04195 [Alphaproteobacteria bacterium]|nr:hypothetical protein [Alphaproteobacteria bacterium]
MTKVIPLLTPECVDAMENLIKLFEKRKKEIKENCKDEKRRETFTTYFDIRLIVTKWMLTNDPAQIRIFPKEKTGKP